jgi:hypothetical protein
MGIETEIESETAEEIARENKRLSDSVRDLNRQARAVNANVPDYFKLLGRILYEDGLSEMLRFDASFTMYHIFGIGGV